VLHRKGKRQGGTNEKETKADRDEKDSVKAQVLGRGTEERAGRGLSKNTFRKTHSREPPKGEG